MAQDKDDMCLELCLLLIPNVPSCVDICQASQRRVWYIWKELLVDPIASPLTDVFAVSQHHGYQLLHTWNEG